MKKGLTVFCAGALYLLVLFVCVVTILGWRFA